MGAAFWSRDPEKLSENHPQPPDRRIGLFSWAVYFNLLFQDSEYMKNMQATLRDYTVWNVETMMRDTDVQKLSKISIT